MHITCISASNIRHAGENSTSLKTCYSIGEMIRTDMNNADIRVDIVNLADAYLVPCTGCGQCFESGECTAQDDFNIIYQGILVSAALFIVSPHYAPIPAKLSMLLEKMEQITFLRWFHDNDYRSDVYRIPVGIIAHGGGNGEVVLRSYKSMVLDTIANALGTAMMDVVSYDDEWPTGIVFPVAEVRKNASVVFPVQEYDWPDVRTRIRPLVEKVLEKVVSK